MSEIFDQLGDELTSPEKIFPKSAGTEVAEEGALVHNDFGRDRKVKKYPSRGGSAYIKWIEEGDEGPWTHPNVKEKYFAGIQNMRSGLAVFQYDKVRLREDSEAYTVAAVGTNVARAMRVWLCNGRDLFDTSFGDIEAVVGQASVLEKEQTAQIFVAEHLGEGKNKKRMRETDLDLGPIGNLRDVEQIHRETAHAVLSLGVDVMDIPSQKKLKEESAGEDRGQLCNPGIVPPTPTPGVNIEQQIAREKEDQLLKRVAVLELELEKLKEEQDQMKKVLEQVRVRDSLQQFLQQNKFSSLASHQHRM